MRQCADGASALALLDDFRPDLIICDYTLPDMTGLEVIRAAKRRLPDAITVLCSIGLPAGIQPPADDNDYIFCDKGELLACISDVIKKHRTGS